MKKLWQKKTGGKLHPALEVYTVGDDWKLDEFLLPYDLQASLAHAKMLHKIGILTQQELADLTRGLDELRKLHAQGKLTLTIEDEDCHTRIENELVARVGDAGKKIHTGRSRNDQVLVALRLLMKDKLGRLVPAVRVLAEQFRSLAKKYEWVPLPGYTHTQQAMLSSLGLWFGAFAEALEDDAKLLDAITSHLDQNPLGSAAGYGVSLPLDREFTARLLGFRKVQNNTIYCQNSRGKFESLTLEGLVQIMLTLSRFAADMLFFTSRECDYFIASDAIVTGSSIMPQKRNLDPLEILRGQTTVLTANHALVRNLTVGLISGYHRDLQLLKKSLLESLLIAEKSVEVVSIVLENIQPDIQTIESKIQPDIFAADVANDLVQTKGISFRDAYQQALQELKGRKIDLQKNLKSKISPGAPGNLKFDR
ncbi:argininosuccinate lyase [Candidatus Peregrinibacteria bacterium]|nr:argininosuccinate lyase [Candidatus Peregrinibacteria bacterium]